MQLTILFYIRTAWNGLFFFQTDINILNFKFKSYNNKNQLFSDLIIILFNNESYETKSCKILNFKLYIINIWQVFHKNEGQKLYICTSR